MALDESGYQIPEQSYYGNETPPPADTDPYATGAKPYTLNPNGPYQENAGNWGFLDQLMAGGNAPGEGTGLIPLATMAAAGAGAGGFIGGGGEALVGGAEGAIGGAGGGSFAGEGGVALGGGGFGGGFAGGIGDAPGINPPGSGFMNAGGEGAGGGAQFIDGTTPMAGLSPETMELLGISSPQGFAGGGASSFALPEFGGTSSGFSGGGMDPGLMGGATGAMGEAGGGSMSGGAEAGSIDKIAALLKKFGMSPATLAQLGLSGVNALRTPTLPSAAKTLQDQAGPGAQQAQAVIQSGGQSSPAWTAQKSSIDATIDQQLQEQAQAIMQNAVNSGQGPDSQVTVQQINKLKTQLETQRQALYAQAQGQNVQAALQSLGIQDQALAQVANAQFKGSEEAKASASATAQNALMLQALSRQQTPAPGP